MVLNVFRAYTGFEKKLIYDNVSNQGPCTQFSSESKGIYIVCFFPNGNQKYSMLSSLKSLTPVIFLSWDYLLWTGMEESGKHTTMHLLNVFLGIISLTVPRYVENQKFEKGRKLTWKRSEVLAWHIPPPDTVRSLFSSKMKPCYTVPTRRSSRD